PTGQQRRCRSSSRSAVTRSRWGWSRASIGRAATSPALLRLPCCSILSGWRFCTSSCPGLPSSPCCEIPTMHAETQVQALQAAARAMGIELRFVSAATEREIDAAFATLAERRIGALVVASDPFFNGRRQQIVAQATRLAVPAIFHQREFALDGGLMSYGTSVTDMYRQAAVYTGRILKGEKPAALPVQQPTKVEFVINLKTAKTLGLAFPLPLIGRADEVIE